MERLAQLTLVDWLSLIPATPVVSLVVALAVGNAVLLFRRERRVAPALTADRPAHADAAFGAAAVIVLHLGTDIVGGRLLEVDAQTVSWWRCAMPLLAGTAVLVVMRLLLPGRRPGAPPVMPTTRRTWLTFGRRAERLAAAAAVATLVAVTVASGLQSTPDADGRYVHVEIPIPNEDIDPLRPWFYGWAYGVPVLICLAVLLVAGIAVLRGNAARPYRDPETVAAERRSRESIARAATAVVGGAAMLTLGGALRFVSHARTTSLEIDGQGIYEASWRYAELAAIGGWLAPVAEVLGFLALFAVMVGSLEHVFERERELAG
ncbi:hypothetical protein [Microbacterium marinilacus]|uniref:DUF1648 domain-containing protein n=1 Tax=Microbacterium marinilacus TaxID=415209 RepID=A0ABP7BGW6_9MICO|nr:hypothetical protein [Microbacterium marinilacus]MBY0689594.1 hypothetical protein [Microbacterium marinilacus]